MSQQSHKYWKEEGGKVWISSAQWAHLTALSAQCCDIDFLIYKQYGSTSRQEHVFRLTLEVALKQSVGCFDLGRLSESLSKTRLTWRCGKWQILNPHILLKKKKRINISTNMSDMLSFNVFLWFVGGEELLAHFAVEIGGIIQANPRTLALSPPSLGERAPRYGRPP